MTVYGSVDLDNLARKMNAGELAYNLRWKYWFNLFPRMPRRLAYWIAGKWHGVRG